MEDLKNSNKKYLLYGAEIYIITVVIIVFSAWMSNMHPYEMKLTVSKYIGLQQSTAILYFYMCAIICLLFTIYIFKTKFRFIKKYVYFYVILQIMGCAWFPSVGKRDALSTQTHKFFAYSLIFGIAVSFFCMLIWSRNIEQKLFSIIGLLYSAIFVLAYTMKVPEFKQTIFIWENLIIFLLFIELSLEDIPGEQKKKLPKKSRNK